MGVFCNCVTNASCVIAGAPAGAKREPAGGVVGIGPIAETSCGMDWLEQPAVKTLRDRVKNTTVLNGMFTLYIL